jgi:integrase
VKLTAKKVGKLSKRPGRYGDGRGLVLEVVSPTNASWLLRYQRHGRERWHGLGPVADFTLAEARLRARAARQLLHDGIDPIDHKRAVRAQQAAAAARAVTFGEVTGYYRTHAPTWKHEKHVAQWRASILGLTLAGKPTAHDYCKALRVLPVARIDTPIILQVLRPLWHDKPETMSRVRARIATVLDYAKAAGYRQGDNPAAWEVIGKLLPARDKVAPVEHFAAVDYREVPAFMAELRQRQGTAARALEFLIFTAARTAEVLQATQDEIKFAEKLWVVPPHRMKGGREHRVPLAPEVLDLLARLLREAGGDFLFIGPQPGKPLSDSALVAVMRRMGRSETAHGFRSAFSDWAHERTGHSNHAIELSLAHSVGSAVEKSYRRGDMFEKRRRLMADWARFCCSPAVQKTGAKIVPMGRGRS